MKIATHFIFDGQAEEAAKFYTSVFPNSEIVDVIRSGDGSVFGVTFELEGQQFIALNAGSQHEFSEATSVYVSCETQEEVDALWEQLSDGGEEGACGWLKDRFGLSWQIIPTALPALLRDPDPQKSSRVMSAMCGMDKIDIQSLKLAYEQA